MTSTGNLYTSKRHRIEQAIARGETLDEICDHLGVQPAEVDSTLRAMDAAIAEDDQPCGVSYVRAAPVVPCGTLSAYKRHLSRREPIDDDCREARRQHDRERRNGRAA